MSPYLFAAVATVVIILYFVASFLTCYVFWMLAQEDLFFTIVNEGYTKAIMKNGKPVRLVMRSAHHKFRCELGKKTDGHSWDIVPYEAPVAPTHEKSLPKKSLERIKQGLSLASGAYLFENLVLVGFPPAHTVHHYPFHWTSLVQDQKGGMVEKPREEIISHILAPQQEVYSALVEDAKTKDMVPVNASIALTIQIVNPYKALFVPHKWLRTVINQIAPDVREVIGRYTLEALTLTSTEEKETASNELEDDPDFKERRKVIEKEYGVKIVLAQFRSIEPTGKHADKITETSLRKYTAEQEVEEAKQRVKVAEQKAKEIDLLADATERRLRKEIRAVTDIGADAVGIRMMELLPKNLQVLGAGVMPTIPLATAAPTKPEKTTKGK